MVPLPMVIAPASRHAAPGMLHKRTMFQVWKSWDLEREDDAISTYELLSAIFSLTALILAAIHLGLSIGQRDRD